MSCAGALWRARSPRALMAALRTLNPESVTVVEEEADFCGGVQGGFAGRFEE